MITKGYNKMTNQNDKLIYSPTQIRTSNMLPDRSTDVDNLEPSRTQQQFQQECDINYIVKQNMETGFISHTNKRAPIWGADLGEATDLKSAMDFVRETNELFNSYDADLRARFQNDPQKFLDFFNDPDNAEEAIKLGLATERPAPTIPQKKTPQKAAPPAPEASEEE